jgi:hypothetical protein
VAPHRYAFFTGNYTHNIHEIQAQSIFSQRLFKRKKSANLCLAASAFILLFGVVAQNPLPVIFILVIAIALPVRLFLIFGIILFIVFSNFDLVCVGLYRIIIIIIIIISSTWTKYQEKPSWRIPKKQRGEEQSTQDFSNRHLPTAVTLQAA